MVGWRGRHSNLAAEIDKTTIPIEVGIGNLCNYIERARLKSFQDRYGMQMDISFGAREQQKGDWELSPVEDAVQWTQWWKVPCRRML
jgi:hypothetical protein